MAYITIKTDADEGSMTLQEEVLPSDLESEFFCTHLVERLRWAVEDADRARSSVASVEDRASPSHAGVG